MRWPTRMPAKVWGSPRMPPSTKRPSRRILTFTQERVGAAPIDRLSVPRDHPFVTALFHDRPGGGAIVRQAASSEDDACARDFLLKHVPAAVQRKATDVEPVEVQAVEHHEHGRRARLVGGSAVEQMKLAADEALVGTR